MQLTQQCCPGSRKMQACLFSFIAKHGQILLFCCVHGERLDPQLLAWNANSYVFNHFCRSMCRRAYSTLLAYELNAVKIFWVFFLCVRKLLTSKQDLMLQEPNKIIEE